MCGSDQGDQTVGYAVQDQGNMVYSVRPLGKGKLEGQPHQVDAELDLSLPKMRDALRSALNTLGLGKCAHDQWAGTVQSVGDGTCIVTATCQCDWCPLRR